MTSLNPSTGKDDGFVRLNISGQLPVPGVGSNPTRVYNQQLSHGGTLDLVEGDFTSVGGQSRQQIFMLNLGGSRASRHGVDVDRVQPQLRYNEPFYVQAASWSPDDSTVYIATTGFHAEPAPRTGDPWTGLCDAAAGLPGHPGQRQPQVDQLHGLRLAVLHRRRREHRVLWRSRAVVDNPQRMRLRRARGHLRARHGGPVASYRGADLQSDPWTRARR